MNPKILIVEDDRDMRRGLMIRLRASGYDVVTAEDGTGAVSTARQEKPDLVLLDLGLPDGNGFAVLDHFNMLPVLCNIPVVVLTGRDRSVAEPIARHYGISAFLRKPVDNDVLLATIAEALATGYRTPPTLAPASRCAELGRRHRRALAKVTGPLRRTLLRVDDRAARR
jgi:DNA-binding response OmpR family regulator